MYGAEVRGFSSVPSIWHVASSELFYHCYLTDGTHHFPSKFFSEIEFVVLQDFLKLQNSLSKLTFGEEGVSLQSNPEV